MRGTLINEIISTLGNKRKPLTPYQTQVLVKRLEAKPYLEPGEKHQLAMSLNMSDKRIANWFRYARSKRRKKEPLCKYMSNLQEIY